MMTPWTANGVSELVLLQNVLLFIVFLYLFFLHAKPVIKPALLFFMVDKKLYLL